MNQEEARKRFLELSGIKPKANINENKKTLSNDLNTVLLIKEAKNGKTYGIVNYGLKYFIKEANTGENLSISDFKFIGGEANARNYTYKNYDRALNSLNNKIFSINEELNLVETEIKEETKCDECAETKNNDIEEGVDFEIEEVNEEFEYEGDKFKVNPFAVCNKTVGSKRENPEKHEKCVQSVKAGSKISESEEINESNVIENQINKITESKIYNDVIDVIAEKLLKENFDKQTIEEKITLAVPQNEKEIETNKAEEAPESNDENDLPFGKKKFDAGIEVDEKEDPKKFIEQLTGKLGQSLRAYNEENVDFDLEKYVINSIISASHTGQMDSEDQNDIISKIKAKNEEKETPKEEDSSNKDENKETVDEVFEIVDLDDDDENDDFFEIED